MCWGCEVGALQALCVDVGGSSFIAAALCEAKGCSAQAKWRSSESFLTLCIYLSFSLET